MVVSVCLGLSRLSLSTVSAQQPPPSNTSNDSEGLDDGHDKFEIAASYARYSSNNQDVDSNVQQQSKMHEAALQNHHIIPSEFEFSDEAVSGTKLHREGLDRLLEAARKGLFKILYFWNLSRLAREIAIALPILKQLVHVYGIRVISVADCIDSAKSGWELQSVFGSYMSQEYLKRLAEDVTRGLRQAIELGYSVGDLCFGYVAEIVPGQEDSSRHRNGKSRKRAVIDPSNADWVRKIFAWYVIERRSINWIKTELNRLKVPRDHRARSNRGWHVTCVRKVLSNEKYIGTWCYGKLKHIRNPLTGKLRQEHRAIDDPGIIVKQRPELRIIDDHSFKLAQGLLEENHKKYEVCRLKNGRLTGSRRDSNQPRHLLQGLMRCSQCGNTSQMNGMHGRYLQCGGYPRGLCTAKTSLLRSYAEQEICRVLHDRLIRDEQWMSVIFQEVHAAWLKAQESSPLEMEVMEKRKSDVSQKIERLIDSVENGNSSHDLKVRLNSRRRELVEIERQLDLLKAGSCKLTEPPTKERIAEKMQRLLQILRSDPRRAGVSLRKLIGTVTISEVELPGLKRLKLVGKFKLNVRQIAASAFDIELPDSVREEEIVIRFAPLPIWAERADEVKALYDQNLSAMEIAKKLGLKFGAIAKALNWWYTQQGLPVPSGTEKRSRIIYAPKRDVIFEDVIALWKADLPLHAIAKQLGTSRNTVTAMVKLWHEQQGLPWLNGQARRKQIRENRDQSDNSSDAA